MFSFKRTPPKTYAGLSVKFHHEANLFGEHGKLNVTNKKMGIIESPVIFVFPGVTTPPKLELGLLEYVWEQAKNQGYIPHYVESYGKDNSVVAGSVV